MKPRCSNKQTNALTQVEVMVVIVVLFIVAALLLPALFAARTTRMPMNCARNLKQVGLAFKEWAYDNGDKYPMQLSVTNGGTMELATGRNARINFLVMSNYLGTPKLLICPQDTKHILATNFGRGFNNDNVSYFVGLNADTNYSQAFLSGDDNFAIGGVPVKSGLLELWTNAPIAWTKARHKYAGNILFADGSVMQTDNKWLVEALQATGVTTNRLAIP